MMGWNTILRCNLEREVEADRQRLREILSRSDDSTRVEELRILADSLGASIIKMYPGYGEANLPEIVQNIHSALQTKAMIAAVRTTSNYVIVTVILAIITLASTVAAFIATFR
jgi:uncharacterized protein with GYD domain